VTGLTKGIRILASIKTTLFVLFLAFVFFFGPAQFILNYAVEGLGDFLGHFFQKALFTGATHDDPGRTSGRKCICRPGAPGRR